jgi:triosephosphate isomerase
MKIIVANWKMNQKFDDADEWISVFKNKFYINYEAFEKVEVIVCPPVHMIDYLDGGLVNDGFEKLEEIAKKQSRNYDDLTEEEIKQALIDERVLSLGAQDCHHVESGSFTGDVSAKMLHEIGCEYVIVGHSERRAGHFESDEIVAKKAKAAINQEIVPIICVGESKEVRDNGQHLSFVENQVKNSIPSDLEDETLIIAYEPIWSIGTGVIPSLEQISEMVKFIKDVVAKDFATKVTSLYVLYGGSVSADNSKDILAIEAVDGLLVGKASLDAEEFVNICLSLKQ